MGRKIPKEIKDIRNFVKSTPDPNINSEHIDIINAYDNHYDNETLSQTVIPSKLNLVKGSSNGKSKRA